MKNNNKKIHLSIAKTNNIHQGIHQAVLFYDVVELIFTDRECSPSKELKRVSLSPDRVSFSHTLQQTNDKIRLICSRLGINEDCLVYDKTPLNTLKKKYYNSLFFSKMLYKMFIPMQWVIVYKTMESTEQWRKIIPPKEVFQADPFIIYNNNKYYVFYEELKFSDYHGYLAVAELDIEKGELINPKTILKRGYHLSYPSVFEEAGRFYMIPESGDNHTVDLYECTDFPYQWQKKRTLLDNIQAVDSTLLKKNNCWYLFTSEKAKGVSYDDELTLYKSSNFLNQPFEKMYDQPVISDVQNARMAGQFIHRDGEIFRVAQDGGKRYGYRAHINKVLQIENGYQETKVSTLEPNSNALGFHTYNEAQGVAVGDQLIARFDFYSLQRFISGNLKRVLC